MKTRKIIVALLVIIAICIIPNFVNAVGETIRVKEKTSDGNYSIISDRIVLVLGRYSTKTLNIEVRDSSYTEITNPTITCSSDNTGVATIDSVGKITAVAVGKANITITSGDATKTFEVEVIDGDLTDVSNADAKLLFDVDTNLQITGITPVEESTYYCVLSNSSTKPDFKKKTSGGYDIENIEGIRFLSENKDEKYLYLRYVDKYVEQKGDVYLWVLEERRLGTGNALYDEDGNFVSAISDVIIDGKKLTKPELPKLNMIIKGFNIGEWKNTNTGEENSSTWIRFVFPTDIENRKFNLKIGKVTDNNILNKIKNNDYQGIVDLLSYAKSNSAIYQKDLVTTRENYYASTETLFGRNLLEDKAFYYIYVIFDDENGKYEPIEGVTLGQAWFSSSGTWWDLFAYTDDKIEWNNLSYSGGDSTTAPGKIPQTGDVIGIVVSVIALFGIVAVAAIKKNRRLKDIK